MQPLTYLKNDRARKIILLIIYATFFVWGICVYKDYGISTDEKVQRDHGLVNFKYVYELINGEENTPEYLKDYEKLGDYGGRYYGVGIKIPLILTEYLNGFQMTNQQIYYMNHLYTFLLFFAASVFVYKIGRKLGLGYKYSVLLVLLFIICPRILADSFYNIKDSVFLSLFTIMIYYGLAVMSEFKVKNAAGLAVSAAFCLNTRIVGALPLFILCIAYLFKDGKFESKRFLHIFMTGVISFGLYILISPAAWSDPAGYIHNTVSVFSNYEANSGTITLGKSVYAYDKLPWYYTILCIWLTMPGFYLIFCVAGIVSVVKQICTGNIKINLTRNILVITLLVQFSVVMIYDAVMKPIKYNMWRHFYFIFLFIVIFAVIGIRNLADSAGKYRSVITAWAGFAVMLTVIWNVRNHPYEFAYYNPLFATDTEDNMRHDYWGVSDHDLLKRVDDNDINVYPRSSVSMFFGEEGWERFHAGSEQYCAEYKFERTDMKGAERWEILYKEEEVTEVDGRRVSAISKRINYDNCLFKYVVDGKGVRGGYWKITDQG